MEKLEIKSKELERLIRWMWNEGLITVDEKYHGRCSTECCEWLIDDIKHIWGIRDETNTKI